MNIRQHLKENYLILDGAMGTMLQKAGLQAGEIPELLNLTHPEQITAVHRAFVEAGSNMVLSCTFGANCKKLADSGYTPEDIIPAAVRNARASGAQYVALDMGPIGELLQPTGTLSFDEAYEIFAQQIRIGAPLVDAIYMETMTDLLEIKAALLAAKELCDKPVFCTMTFEENHRTFLGVPPEAAAITLEGLGADAIGINCSLGPDKLLPIAKKMSAFCNVPMIIKANAGLPIVSGDTFTYDITPDQFAQAVEEYLPFGFSVLGGCCGTTPDYIQKICAFLPKHPFTPRTPKKITAVCSGTHFVNCNQVRVIGERINPTGKKKFREALKNGDMDYILGQALSQIDAGAPILDVNVGTPEIDEKSMMLRVMQELQAVVDTPLQLDSSNPEVLECALRHYNGIPIINSVNGERKSMDSIMPLAKKYGALLVALALDEDGIPPKAEGRVRIAEKIVNEAAKYGIPPHHLLIDCLTLTVSAEPDGAIQTLHALETVKRELGVKSVLGVSNVSFGLPQRELINSHFLALALSRGLDFPIINPNKQAMMDAVYTHNLLFQQDPGGEAFIEHYADTPASPTGGAAPAASADMTCEEAILKGLGNECARITQDLLSSMDAMAIISDVLIPALDTVGDLYEKGKIFLPQLIRSAEAAKFGFDVIKDTLQKNGGGQVEKGTIVLATVKGDIHDIGKNIVKVVLENYGYTIIDLGRDVPPETVVQAAMEHHAPMVGLSALMTTTLPGMEETVRQLHEAGYPGKIFVGGAVLTPEYAASIGADFYSKDAKASADIAKQVIG